MPHRATDGEARQSGRPHIIRCRETVQYWQSRTFGNPDGRLGWEPRTLDECVERLIDLDDMVTYWRAWHTSESPDALNGTYRPASARIGINDLQERLISVTLSLGNPIPREVFDVSTESRFRDACDELQAAVRLLRTYVEALITDQQATPVVRNAEQSEACSRATAERATPEQLPGEQVAVLVAMLDLEAIPDRLQQSKTVIAERAHTLYRQIIIRGAGCDIRRTVEALQEQSLIERVGIGRGSGYRLTERGLALARLKRGE